MKKLTLGVAFWILPLWTVLAAEKLPVASFSTVLTEIAREVGGDRVVVSGLISPGIDPHEYEPTPSDLRQVAQARLILTSGKNLENYLSKLQQASGGKAEFLSVGDSLPGLTPDPHWWSSVQNVEQATRLLRDRLSKLDPAGAGDFATNARNYLARLDELQQWIGRKVAELPRNQRRLVTAHDAFRYFARDYGFTVSAIEGVEGESEPSNRHVAELIDLIKTEKVKAIFVESTLNPKVSQEIIRETGAKIGGSLCADGLGRGEASTYAGMMRLNVSTIVDALK